MAVEKITGGPRADGSIEIVGLGWVNDSAPMIAFDETAEFTQQQWLQLKVWGRWFNRLSNAGPAKPTTPTSGNT